MELMVREEWTDKRLDDLNDRVSQGFERLDEDMRELRTEIKDLRKGLRNDIKDEVGTLRRETNERFVSIDARFDAMHRTMMRGFLAIGGITINGFVGLAGLQVF